MGEARIGMDWHGGLGAARLGAVELICYGGYGSARRGFIRWGPAVRAGSGPARYGRIWR